MSEAMSRTYLLDGLRGLGKEVVAEVRRIEEEPSEDLGISVKRRDFNKAAIAASVVVAVPGGLVLEGCQEACQAIKVQECGVGIEEIKANITELKRNIVGASPMNVVANPNLYAGYIDAAADEVDKLMEIIDCVKDTEIKFDYSLLNEPLAMINQVLAKIRTKTFRHAHKAANVVNKGIKGAHKAAGGFDRFVKKKTGFNPGLKKKTKKVMKGPKKYVRLSKSVQHFENRLSNLRSTTKELGEMILHGATTNDIVNEYVDDKKMDKLNAFAAIVKVFIEIADKTDDEIDWDEIFIDIQEKLVVLNFLKKKHVNGAYGRRFEKALMKFENTYSDVFEAYNDEKGSRKKKKVKKIQRFLIMMGFMLKGSVNGVYDEETQKASMHFFERLNGQLVKFAEEESSRDVGPDKEVVRSMDSDLEGVDKRMACVFTINVLFEFLDDISWDDIPSNQLKAIAENLKSLGLYNGRWFTKKETMKAASRFNETMIEIVFLSFKGEKYRKESLEDLKDDEQLAEQIQRFLISCDFLPDGADDGDFRGKSKKALAEFICFMPELEDKVYIPEASSGGCE